jgi:hypothetical protein
MADTESGGEYSSHILVKSGGDSDIIICRRCREYEIQLGKALDGLSSVLLINKLLQNNCF